MKKASTGALGAVYACDSDPTRVIKVIEPKPGFVDPDETQRCVDEFFARMQAQRELYDQGAQFWVPVFDLGSTEAGGAYAVIPDYPRSLQWLFASQVRLPGPKLQFLFQEILQGLEELRVGGGRCHLRLTPSNVLLDSHPDGEFTVKLADPASFGDLGPSFEKSDLQSVGKMLYQAVLQKEVPEMFQGPVAMTDAWKRLGAGDKWQVLCDELLHPGGPTVDFDEVVRRVGRAKRKSGHLLSRLLTPAPQTRSPKTPGVKTPGLRTSGGTPRLTEQAIEAEFQQDDLPTVDADPVGATLVEINQDGQYASEESSDPEVYSTPMTMEEVDQAPTRRLPHLLKVGVAALLVGAAAGTLAMLAKPPPAELVLPTTKPASPSTRGSTTRPSAVMKLIAQANSLREIDLDGALSAAEKARLAAPGDAAIEQLLKDLRDEKVKSLTTEALSHIANRRFDDAIEALDKANRVVPGHSDVTRMRVVAFNARDMEKAQDLLDQGKMDDASKQARAVLARTPNEPDAVAFLNRLTRHQELAEKTKKCDALAAEAKVLDSDGKFADSAKKIREAIALLPEHPAAKELAQAIEKRLQGWQESGQEQFASGHYADAVRYLDQVLNVEPDRPGVKQIRDNAAACQSAEALIAEAERLLPTNRALAEQKLSEAERLATLPAAQRVRNAISAMDQAQKDISGLLDDAARHEKAGRWDLAMKDFASVIVRDQKNAVAAAGLDRLKKRVADQLRVAELKESSEQFADARSAFDELLRHDPANAIALESKKRIGLKEIAKLSKIREEAEIKARLADADKLLAEWNPEEALKRLDKATDADSKKRATDIRAQQSGASKLIAQGDSLMTQDAGKAATWYDLASRLGRVDAMVKLGMLYRLGGKGQPADSEKAVLCFTRAANRGDIGAMTALASMLAGNDRKSAAEWTQKAAEAGDGSAMMNLASRYEIGDGVARSDQAAVLWYKRAAEEKGNAEAMYRLGLCYETGRGVAKNPDQARLYFQGAKNKGFGPAIAKLEPPKPPVAVTPAVVTPSTPTKPPVERAKDDNGL